MRQLYYAVEHKLFQELRLQIQNYNEMLKKTYDKNISRSDRSDIMDKKEEIEIKIQETLQEKGKLMGYIPEGELDKLEDQINLLKNKKIYNILKSNCIDYENIEESLFELRQHEDIEIVNKLILFLENARKDNNSIIVWIM